MAQDDIICPHCSVETSREELRQNRLCCTTCGFDFSEAEDPEDRELDQDWDEQYDADGDDDEEEAWSV